MSKQLPIFGLNGRGKLALLSTPEEQRQPLLISDVSLLLTALYLPSLNNTGASWFKMSKCKNITNVTVIIVDSCNADSIGQEITSHRTSESVSKKQKLSVDASSNSAESEIVDMRVFKRISEALPLVLEVVAPKRYGETVVESLLRVPVPQNVINVVERGMLTRPLTMKLLHGDKVLAGKLLASSAPSNSAKPEILQQNLLSNTNMSLCKDESEYFLAHKASLINYYDNFAQRCPSKHSEEVRAAWWQSGREINVVNDQFDRRSLLMNLDEMVQCGIPIPKSVYRKLHLPDPDIYPDYFPTKIRYDPVTPQSPVFGLDCEFRLKPISEASFCNESLQCVYFVEVNKRTNLENQMKRIREEIRLRLPADAILVGHEICNDLTALGICHPYIIDTAVHFMCEKNVKSSLSSLARRFLQTSIQKKEFSHHSSLEDCVATVWLLLLKLRNHYTFGRVDMQGLVSSFRKEESERCRLEKAFHWHLFECLLMYRKWKKQSFVRELKSRFRVLAHKDILKAWTEKVTLAVPADCIIEQVCESNAGVVDALCSDSDNFDISIGHLQREDHCLSKNARRLDKHLRRVYDELPVGSVMLVLITAAEQGVGQSSNDALMCGVKSN